MRPFRTSCYNDRCLFLTNVESFPDRRIIAYNPNLDLYDLERVHDQYYDTGTHYIKYPYHHAVDGNDHTAWKSRQRKFFSRCFALQIPNPFL